MTTGNEALAVEVATALDARSERAALGRWLLNDRRRLLPYIAIGGSVVGSLAGAVLTGRKGDDLNDLAAVGLGAGVAAGLAVGWVVFTLAAARSSSMRGRLRLRLLRAALSLPAYAAAGVVAYVAAAAFGGATDRIVAAFGSALIGIAAAGVLLIPLGLAMARRSQAAPIRGATLAGAISETLAPDESGSLGWGRTGATVLFAIVWFFVATIAVFGLLAAWRSAAPDLYDAAFRSFGTPIGIALLVGWLATIVVGTRKTLGLFFRRSTRPRR